MLPWIYLLSAAVAEVFYGIGVFHSNGFTRPVPIVIAVVSGIVTSILLGLSMKQLPIGLSFVIWSGLAMVGTTLYGIFFLNEPHDPVRIGLLTMVFAGTVGLKLTASTH